MEARKLVYYNFALGRYSPLSTDIAMALHFRAQHFDCLRYGNWFTKISGQVSYT